MDDRGGTIPDEGADHRSAGEKVKDTAHEAKEKASHMAGKARDAGGHLADEGREKAGELAHRAGDMARSRAEEEKVRVAGGIRTVAEALRRGGQDLPEDREAYGRFVTGMADRAEGLSRYLEEHDVDEMAREVRRFGREHTAALLSGAFTVGLIGARFLKSSGDRARPESERWGSPGYTGDRTYESGYRTSGGYIQPGGESQADGYAQPGGARTRSQIHSGSRGSIGGSDAEMEDALGDGAAAPATDRTIDRIGGTDA